MFPPSFVATLLSKWEKNDGVQKDPDFSLTIKERKGNVG
jgi:hypothetical protein